jgi:DNA polymerase elongation subunit (family B)
MGNRMKIVKPSAEIKYAIIHGKQTTCYMATDCVPIDIDKVQYDWEMECARRQLNDEPFISFSEYLQERMK